MYNEHLSRYYFAQPLVVQKSVIDLGCGAGYGSAVLAKSASSVLGLDISKESVDFARRNYSAPNLDFAVSDCCQTGLKSGSFDAVVCFEVIEHLASQELLIEEIQRVLTKDGFLIISTPNRVYYTEERKESNPYHTREFDFDEFSGFLKSYFGKVVIGFQNHVSSIFIGNPLESRNFSTRLESQSTDLNLSSNYFMALCSQTQLGLPDFDNLVYLPAAGNLLREKERRVQSLESQVTDLDHKVLKLQMEYDEQTQWCLELNRQMEERTQWAVRLDAQIKERDARILELQEQFSELAAWTRRLTEQMAQKDERILTLQSEFDERTNWALRLNEDLKDCQGKLERIKQSKLFQLSKAFGLVPKI